MYGILLQHLFLCYSNCVQSAIVFFYMVGMNIFFVNELNNAYFIRHILEQFLGGKVLHESLLQLLLEHCDCLNIDMIFYKIV